MSSHVLIFGFGYTAHFLAKKLASLDITVTATTRQHDVIGYDKAHQCNVIDFSETAIETCLATVSHILISVPPDEQLSDPVLFHFMTLLKKYSQNIKWIGYLSSTSVYGDHQGQWVDETSTLNHPGKQGVMRIAAENQWRLFAQQHQIPLHIFRLSGIYGPQRNILLRLKQGKQETIIKKKHYFSRIHVEDIALIIIAAMQYLTSYFEVFNVADDEPTPAYIVDEFAASLLKLPHLKRIPYDEAVLSPMAKEFYTHNKRVSNEKIKQLLRIKLLYPTFRDGLMHMYHSNQDLK